MNKAGQSPGLLLEETVFTKLSPLQKKILLELSAGPQTLNALSRRTGSSIHSVGKQLSLFQFRAKYNPLKGKGVSRPLVKKQKGQGVKTTYFLV